MGIDKKMKILMINDSDEIGGVDTYINLLSKLLRHNGHEVYYLCLSPEKNLEEEYFKRIKYRFKNKIQWFFSENVIDFELYKQIRKHILSIKPDIIHFHNIYKATKTILLASRGFPKIQTVHDFGVVCPLHTLTIEKRGFSICGGKKGLKCYSEGCVKFQTNLLDYFIFDSSYLKKKTIGHFICPSKQLKKTADGAGFIRTIYLSNFYKTKSEVKYADSDNILYIGRLEKEKGVQYLLKAFRHVLSKNNKLRLIIIGDGSQSDYLKNLSRVFKVKNYVDFIGKVNHKEISAYFKDSFVVVMPSIWMENSPLVAYEAMSYSKPIVAFNIGGLADLVQDGKNGFLVERFDAYSLAEKIIYLYDNKSQARMMGKIGWQILKDEYNCREHIESIASLYLKAIKNGKNI